MSKSWQKVGKKLATVVKKLATVVKKFSKNVKKLSKISQKFVLSKNLSIICPFAQIVRRRRRLVAPRPGGDFVAPGKNPNILFNYAL
jgi:hypothetical protein